MNVNWLNKLDYLITKHKELICIILFAIYVIFSLQNPNMYSYCYDEIHAWNIAGNLNFFEIVKLMKVEGHGFVWFILLKPFTYFEEFFLPWILKFFSSILDEYIGSNH